MRSVALTDDKALEPTRIILGRVAGVFGVKGWVKLQSFTDPRTAILEYDDCLLGRSGEWRPAELNAGKAHGKGVIAQFAGVNDRDQAAELIGAEIAVSRSDMPEPGEGHYYWADLEGLEVVLEDGTVLGQVAYLIGTGANDVLVVQGGEREILIPFLTGSVVKNVSLSDRRISVDWEWE